MTDHKQTIIMSALSLTQPWCRRTSDIGAFCKFFLFKWDKLTTKAALIIAQWSLKCINFPIIDERLFFFIITGNSNFFSVAGKLAFKS